MSRSEEHTSELQSQFHLVCPLFFLNDTAPTEIYSLSLHDALPISLPIAIGGLPAPDQLIKFRELLKREHERPPLLHRLVRLIPVRLHRGRQEIYCHVNPAFREIHKLFRTQFSAQVFHGRRGNRWWSLRAGDRSRPFTFSNLDFHICPTPLDGTLISG